MNNSQNQAGESWNARYFIGCENMRFVKKEAKNLRQGREIHIAFVCDLGITRSENAYKATQKAITADPTLQELVVYHTGLLSDMPRGAGFTDWMEKGRKQDG